MDRELATTGAELERLQNQVLAVQATMNDALAAANHRYEQRVVECVFLSCVLSRKWRERETDYSHETQTHGSL